MHKLTVSGSQSSGATVTIIVNPNDIFSGRMMIEVIEQVARLAGQRHTIKVQQERDQQAAS